MNRSERITYHKLAITKKTSQIKTCATIGRRAELLAEIDAHRYQLAKALCISARNG